MKYIAIVDIPDDYDAKEWAIDDDGTIRYLEENVWMQFKEFDMIRLKPMPKQFTLDEILMAKDVKNSHRDACV